MCSSTRLKCAFIAYMNQTARMTRHVGRTRLVDGASSTLGGGLGMHRVYGAKHQTEGQKHLENLRAQKTGSNFKNRRMNASKAPGHRESVGLQARERMWAGKANGPNSCRYMAMSRLHICRKHEMAVAWQQAMKHICMWRVCACVCVCVCQNGTCGNVGLY